MTRVDNRNKRLGTVLQRKDSAKRKPLTTRDVLKSITVLPDLITRVCVADRREKKDGLHIQWLSDKPE